MSATKPTVLVLDEEPPLPLDTGKRIRTFNLLSALAEDFQIEILVHDGPDIATAAVALREHGIVLHAAPSRLPPQARRDVGASFRALAARPRSLLGVVAPAPRVRERSRPLARAARRRRSAASRVGRPTPPTPRQTGHRSSSRRTTSSARSGSAWPIASSAR
ncbi:MAG: hypothetical protein HC882_02260 [Acidobacteria bacterium]|nr:hypothetical protein [Acidobacteriota bacterium]